MANELEVRLNRYLIERGLQPWAVDDVEATLKRFLSMGCRKAQDLLAEMRKAERPTTWRDDA